MNPTLTTHADFEVSTARSFAELRPLAGVLREGEAAVDFFQTWSWFENLAARGIEAELEPLLVVVRRKSTGAVFALPLLRRPRAPTATFGSVVSGLSNYYSSLYGPVGDAAHLSVEALRAVVVHLRRRHRPCAVIDLRPLDAEGSFYALMQEALRAEGYRTAGYFCFGNWHLEVDGRSYAAYANTLPSRLRNTIKRGRKKLEGAGASIRVHAEPGEDLDQAIADFEAVYAKSWKVPEPFPDFVPGMCRMAASEGWLRLGVVRLEGQPIAAQIWLIKDRRALIYKLAYDEAHKRYSAGSVLTEELMRRSLDDEGVVDVDYLTGDDDYKLDWMSHRRERMGIAAFDPRTLQGAVSLVQQSAGRLRRLLARPAPAADSAAPQPGPAASEEAVDRQADASKDGLLL